MKKSQIFPSNHIKAILILRWITFKRSWKFTLKSFIGTLIFSTSGILLYWILLTWANPRDEPFSYNFYNNTRSDFYIVGDENDIFISNVTRSLTKILLDKGCDTPKYVYFKTLNDLQEKIYQLQVKDNKSKNIQVPIGIDFSLGQSNVVILHNNTIINGSDSLNLDAFMLFSEILWNIEFNQTDFEFDYSSNMMHSIKSIFSAFGSFLLVSGLLTSSLLITSRPISDIRGEVRQYMMQSSLTFAPYWLANFICDFIIWMILTTIICGLFIVGVVIPFFYNFLNMWYLLVLQGPSMILYMYCFSFAFSNPEAAPRQILIFSILLVLLSSISGAIIGSPNPIVLDYFWVLFPPTSLQQIIYYVISNMGYETQNLKYYWKNDHTLCYLFMQFGDILIYSFLLTIIEAYRDRIQRKFARITFSNYVDVFNQIKNKYSQSDEAKNMEEDVHNSSDWAVRIQDVSRLFINNEGKPIVAVNNVSLGVKEFSIFGFLGANGAGKTTLIRMITGMLPPSSGKIELFGTKIEDIKDSNIVALCPQFNSHLIKELTPKEHFKVFSLIYQLDEDDVDDVVEDLISGMELNDVEDVPVYKLSTGDARKLGIALSFFRPSKILILDEPTESLDPISCRCVQQMILEHKGEKTFILCTHLLREAEFLCDAITIMVNGRIYTVGTPQYLSEKFGKTYRIDIELDDTTKACFNKVKEFFQTKLPDAKLSIKRPKSQIYSIPDYSISLANLFDVLQKGKNDDNGFCYFTCSSSSLERVFLQIVHMSEMAGTNFVDDELEEDYYVQDSSSNQTIRSKLSSFFSNSKYSKIVQESSSDNDNDDNQFELP